jgi:hypothetical protein
VTPGRAVRLLLLLVAVALATQALGAPRFTWANDGVRVDHPWTQAAAALGAALALVAAAWTRRPIAWPIAAGIAAVALAALGAERAAYQLDAVATGIRGRSLGGSVELPWPSIEAVEPRAGSLTLRARDGRALVIRTGGFAPDERVRLERTIARRVTEASK